MTDPTDRAALAVELLAAAQALQQLDGGLRLAPAIATAAQRLALPARSRAAVQDISFATVRRLGWANAMAALLNRKQPSEPLFSLQRVALVQLDDAVARAALPGANTRHPAVIVDQAVQAVQTTSSATGNAPQAAFLNATLRRFLREREALNGTLSSDPQAQHNFPGWWLTQLRADHPHDWPQIVAASNQQPPMCLRVNRRRLSRDAYLQQLAQAGIKGVALGRDGIALAKSLDVTLLPGYAQGHFSVQDGGAQMAAYFLDVSDGHTVLDACAAPGGKAAHLLELADLQLLALDSEAHRMIRVQENLKRLQLHAQLRTADACEPARWWDGVCFDRILVDAPCSASGIVRRHPDVRWLRKRGDIATLCRLQRRLLEALWPLLKPGGKLLYVTCSVFRAEGERMVAAFTSAHANSAVQPLYWNWSTGMSSPPLQAGAANAGTVSAVAQLLPTASMNAVTQAGGLLRDHDGFFYALIEKRT